MRFTVDKGYIQYLSKPQTIVKYLFYIIVIMFSVFSVVYINVKSSYDKLLKRHHDYLDNTFIPKEYSKKDGMIARCKIVACVEIYTQADGVLKRFIINNNVKTKDTLDVIGVSGINIPVFHRLLGFTSLTQDYELLIFIEDEAYALKEGEYIKDLLVGGYSMFLVLLFMFTVVALYTSYIGYRKDTYERNTYKIYTETKVQGNISEMLHHEILTPITILKSISVEVGIIIGTDSKLYQGFTYAINQLEATLSLLYQGRYVKKEQDNKSLEDAIGYVVSSVNLVNVHKIKFMIDNDDATKFYLSNIAIDKRLGAGSFINILTVMLNNSIEASANMVRFKAIKFSSTLFWLYISDNGHGIQDKSGNLMTNSLETICSYGWTSKDKNGKPLKEKLSLFRKLLSYIKVDVSDSETSRGVGLYTNRILLERAGGNLELVETTYEGTTFRILLPYRKLPKI